MDPSREVPSCHTAPAVAGDAADLQARMVLLESLVDQASDPIFSLREDGTYRYVNQAFAASHGRDPGDIIDRHTQDLFPPEEAARGLDLLRRVLDTGRPLDAVLSLGEATYLTTLTPVTEVSGRFVAGIAKDITEQKRGTDEALRRSEERFRQISEASDEWIWEVDPEGLYTYASPAVARTLGYTPEELVGRFHFYDLFPPAERERLLPQVFRAFAEHRPLLRVPNASSHKNGDLRMLETTGLPILSREGRLLGYRGVDRDVTEKHAASQSIRESETRFRGLFEASPIAVMEEDFSRVKARFDELRALGVEDLRGHLAAHPADLLDLAGRVRIVQVNSAAARLVGASTPEEVIRALPTYFSDESMGVFREEMAALFQGETRFGGEIPVLDIHGGRMIHRLDLSVIPGHEADLSRVLVSLSDLTAQRHADAERERLEKELNHLHRLESLGRLASGVSHDMNNVLAAIMAVASVLQLRHPDDPEIQRDADSLLQAAGRGRDLVKGLRDFSRKELEAATELDLNELARREADLLERTLLKRVEVALDLSPGLPPVFGEAGAIRNALMNLCANATDAMPHGGTLTLITRDLGQGFVELTVQDDGEGMPRDVLARAMEPFYTTKPAGKGTGLGLSQVYGTMKAHGGSMDIQSRPGQGTRVTLAFPQATGAAAPPGPGTPPSAAPARSLRILLVDDEELVCRVTLGLFKALGHRAQAVSSGLAALRQVEAGLEADLVVLDLSMPGMDGLETISRLRALRPHLPVLISTGFADERIPKVLNRFPNVQIVNKPFTIQDFQEVLRSWP